MNPYLHGQIFHDKEGKGIQWGKKIAFSVNNVRKTGQLHVKDEIKTFPSIICKNKLKTK